jgi:Flp pilus assembly protein TadG
MQLDNHAAHRSDRGSAAIELVIIVPVIMLIALLMIFAGRVMSAQGDVVAAARAAATAAVVQASGPAAAAAALQVASATLASEHMACPHPTVTTDLVAFVPGGTVRVTVTCVANFSDVTAVGVPGSKTFTASALAPVDTYRVAPS